MMNNGPAYAPQQPKKSSTGKILLGLGLGCGGLILLAIVVIGIVAYTGYNKIANSEGMRAATAFVQNSPEAREELGTPIETSFAGGNFNINNGTGDAEIQLNATGPKGKGLATVELHCVNNGPWSVTSSTLTNGPSGETITLK